jgi:hypothetical protein
MPHRARQIFVAAAAAATICAVASGCGDGGGGGGGQKKAASPPKQNVDTGRFDPANFGNPAAGRNRWDPIKPGRQSVREGLVNVGHRRLTHRRVYTVTGLSKKIDGVRAAVVIDQDFNGGQLSEQALDYVAEDKQGNVWSLGSYTETYEGGQFVNATDGWLAGVNGSRPGIIMKARPQTGATYFESKIAGGSERTPSKVVKTGGSKCVPFKCYRDVVVIEEGGGSGSGTEWKYYAPGVGGILTEPRYKGGEQETERLLNATQLSPRALAEISAEALKVDRHAPSVARSVFGRAAPAKRDL